MLSYISKIYNFFANKHFYVMSVSFYCFQERTCREWIRWRVYLWCCCWNCSTCVWWSIQERHTETCSALCCKSCKGTFTWVIRGECTPCPNVLTNFTVCFIFLNILLQSISLIVLHVFHVYVHFHCKTEVLFKRKSGVQETVLIS